MKVLIACEFSGVERDAFLTKGHDAISCDLIPSDSPGPHYQGDVRDLMGEEWDLVIAHPPCTTLANSSVHLLHKHPDRWADLDRDAAFFLQMWDFKTDRLCVENPKQHKYAKERHGKGKADQYVQPYQFGHMQTKLTGYWLVNLPKLVPTSDLKEEVYKLPEGQRPPGIGQAPAPTDGKKDLRASQG